MPRSSVIALVLANVFPLVGVLFWNWSLDEVLALYWAETGVIGVFNVAKLLAIGGVKAVPIALFFVVHFGGFMFGHAVFLIHFFFSGAYASVAGGWTLLQGLWLELSALFVSHAFSHVVNFVRGGEAKTRSLGQQMTMPYRRIVVMHITIILGAALTMGLGQKAWVLLLLIGFKVGSDILAHRREHRVTPPGESLAGGS